MIILSENFSMSKQKNSNRKKNKTIFFFKAQLLKNPTKKINTTALKYKKFKSYKIRLR